MASKIRVLATQNYFEINGMVTNTGGVSSGDGEDMGWMEFAVGELGPQKGHAVITLRDKNGTVVQKSSANIGAGGACSATLTPGEASALDSSSASAFHYTMAPAQFSTGTIEIVTSGKLNGYHREYFALVEGQIPGQYRAEYSGNGVFTTVYAIEVYTV